MRKSIHFQSSSFYLHIVLRVEYRVNSGWVSWKMIHFTII